MKVAAILACTFAALVFLQGCAVNIIVAPDATFVGGSVAGDSIESQNNGRVSTVLATVPAFEE
jgi:small basic protein